MRNTGKFIALLACLLPFAAQAGRPLAVDDAEPVAAGRCELEIGASWLRSPQTHHYDFPIGLTLGISTNLEAGIGFGCQLEQRQAEIDGHETACDYADLNLATKWKFLSATQAWADHALAFTAKIPTSSRADGFSSGAADYDFTYIATKPVTDRLALHLNAGFTLTGADDDVFHAGLAAGCMISKTVELVGEIFTNVPLGHEELSPVASNCGLRWNCCKDLTLDLALGAGLRGEATDFTATFGFTWAFDLKPSTTR